LVSRTAAAVLFALSQMAATADAATPLGRFAVPASAPDLIVAAATLPGPGPLPALIPPALLKAHHGAATLDDAIDQCMTQAMTAANTPGAAVAVALDGALILERGYGIFLADLDEDGVPESDFEFLDRGVPGRVSWLRNRGLVGSPRLTPRHARGSLLVPVPVPVPDQRWVHPAIVTDED